jgi:chromosome segregation ATPase
MVHETPQNTVEKEWKSFMKKNDGKLSAERGEIVAHNVVIKKLGPYAVTVYARIEKTDEAVKVIVAVAPESNTAGMKDIIEDFARELTKESFEEQQKEAERVLESAERNLARLERDNSDLHNDINRCNEKIKEAEADIKENLKAQEEAKNAVDVKRKTLDTIKGKASNVN